MCGAEVADGVIGHPIRSIEWPTTRVVICCTPDEVGAQLEKVWEVADSVSLGPPASGVASEQIVAYSRAIAELFYG